MIFLVVFSCFLVGGSPTKIDDFSLVAVTLVYLFFRKKLNIKMSSAILILTLICVYIFNMLRNGVLETNGLLVMFSIVYIILVMSQLIKSEEIIKNFNSRRTKLQIFIVWLLLFLYVIYCYQFIPGRISSPGILFNTIRTTTFISDSHIFAAQVAFLSLACIYQFSKLRIIIFVFSLTMLILIGSRSGPFIFLIGTSLLVFKFDKLKNISISIWVLISCIILGVLLYFAFVILGYTDKPRALTIGGVSDVHRLQIIQNALNSITPLDLFIGDDNAFKGNRKYYDNFFITLFLLTGFLGIIIFCITTFIPLININAYKLIIILLTLFPLSDFLLIPRFQVIFFIFITVSLKQWSIKHVHKNNKNTDSNRILT